ncbi:MAG TPA: GtrA family protein [Kiritimatiellia bacterium]|nr:GtrA family protein [Kiritimatiellia bacterium]
MFEEILQQFLQREASPLIQFIKYGIAGGVATLTDILVFYLIAWKVLPALRPDDPIVTRLGFTVTPITELQRSQRFIVITVCAFMVSNLVAYVSNILWVFEPGRHAWYIEVGLFYAVSGVSIFLGTSIGWSLIRFFHLSTTTSYVSKMIASLLINFVGRKFFVFLG